MLLILGSGRSGTTWLGKLFDSHPDVFYLHEPDAVRKAPDLTEFPGAEEIDDGRERAAAYLTDLASLRYPGVVGKPPHFPKAYRGLLGNGAYRAMLFGAKAVRRLAMKLGLRDEKWPGPEVPLFQTASADTVPVLKSVSAVCRAPLYLSAEPELRIVLVIRHVNGRLASLKRGIASGLISPDPQLEALFATPEAALYPFTKDDIASRPLLEQLAWSWMVQNDKVVTDCRKSSRFLAIVYEDLCRAPVRMLGDLFTFAGLPESDQTTHFLEWLETAPQDDTSYYGVIHPPLASIDRWRTDLTEREQTSIHEIVRHARTGPVRRALDLD